MKPDYLNDDKLPGELSKLKKENPFIVPANYFDSLAGNVQQKIDALPDLEKTSPGFSGFRVPDGYFDSLPMAVQQRIADAKKKNIFEEWIAVVLLPKFSLSLSIFIILLIFGIKYFTKTAGTKSSTDALSYNEIINSEYVSELDESVLIDILEDENRNESVNEDNSLEQYLIDNDVDISQLENRL
jgi:hypothetical protein